MAFLALGWIAAIVLIVLWFMRLRTCLPAERHRWDDGSSRPRVTTDKRTRLELIKGIRPGQQPDGEKR